MINIRVFIKDNAFLATCVMSVFIVSIWTLFKFVSTSSNFDLIGQQLLARQLLLGGADGAIVGPTNYLFKLLFLYIPFELSPLNPKLSLIIMTLIINGLSIVFIAIGIRNIMRLLNLKITTYFYLAILWLAAMAGSIFWIQFTNSRNIEVAGGIFLIYCCMVLFERFSKRHLLVLLILSPILFFSDPLQIYMTAVPSLAYGGYLLTRHRKDTSRVKRYVLVLGLICLAVIASRILFSFAAHLTNIQFIQSGSSTQAIREVIATPLPHVIGTMKANAILFSGFISFMALQVISICTLLVVLIWWAYTAIHQSKKDLLLQQHVVFLLILSCVMQGVYFASGQAVIDGTYRYLIMMAPVLTIIVATLKHHPYILLLLRGFVIFSVLALASLFLNTLYERNTSSDSHLFTIHQYVTTHNTSISFASMDTAIPYNYYFSSSGYDILPLECTAQGVAPSRLFFGYKSALSVQYNSSHTVLLPVILDGNSIRNAPNTCTEEQITEQLGMPSQVTTLDDSSRVLLYEKEDIASFLMVQ